jgi:Lon-like protease
MKRPIRIAALVALFGLTLFVCYFRLPYYAVGPGPAREVGPLIDVKDHQRYDSAGKLIMTTVSYAQVTALQALGAWFDPVTQVVHRDVLFAPGEDPSTERQRAISEMDTSKINATYVVMQHLTDYPKEHADGALIQATVEGCPAFDELFPGDLITAIDGEPVASSKQASTAIDAVPDDEPIAFTVRAAGETHDVSLTREACAKKNPEPYVGISTVNPFPIPVSISSGDIGGPSAGLMFALGLYDALTPGDLTDGRTIAGTGTMAPDGTVGPIGGITDKVVAAERVGATVFLVPKDNMAELEGVDVGDMQLISVATFDQAVRELEALSGEASEPS